MRSIPKFGWCRGQFSRIKNVGTMLRKRSARALGVLMGVLVRYFAFVLMLSCICGKVFGEPKALSRKDFPNLEKPDFYPVILLRNGGERKSDVVLIWPPVTNREEKDFAFVAHHLRKEWASNHDVVVIVEVEKSLAYGSLIKLLQRLVKQTNVRYFDLVSDDAALLIEVSSQDNAD
jgi:hypothetical protein